MKITSPTLDNIKCPNCGESIPVSETIYHQIAEQARAESKAELLQQQRTIAAREQELKGKEAAIDRTIDERVAAKTGKIEADAKIKATSAVSIEIQDLKKQLTEATEQRDIAQRAELAARKRERELDQKAKDIDLETARRIDAERQKIQDDATKRVEHNFQLKLAEKDKQIQDAKIAHEELKRKLEQGSQQLQGEVSEIQLEDHLRAAFPTDQIEPVPKGINGADIVQRVFTRSGQPCGIIVWESKRTKAWSDGWLQKLKDDQRSLAAEIAVLVSEVLPKECSNFAQVSGTWVSNPACAISLASALRSQLLQVATVRAAKAGAREKMEVLYHYVLSTEFRHRVESMAEAFIAMQSGLQEEKRVAQRLWAKREKQIEQVISNTTGMYGDLQGLIGLPDIPALAANASEESDTTIPTGDIFVSLPASATNGRQDNDVPF